MPETLPTTEEEIRSRINERPIPRYDGTPKRVHRRLASMHPNLLDGLRNYFMFGDHVGDFLTGVIRNNFVRAAGHADDTSIRLLRELSTYLRWYPPDDSWGGTAQMEAWQEKGGLVGERGPEKAWRYFERKNL